jgi:hypothetical protein
MALDRDWIRLRPNTLPWKPVELDSKPTWLAHLQLYELSHDRTSCQTALARSRLMFTAMPDRKIDDACGFTNVVRADRLPIAFDHKVVATCALTAALCWY